MKEEDFKELDNRVYAFSIDVFSFVKTLSNKGTSTDNTRLLLNTSQQLYSILTDSFSKKEGLDKIKTNRCEQLAGICANYLENIEVAKKELNEKVDLTIEARQLNTILKKHSLK